MLELGDESFEPIEAGEKEPAVILALIQIFLGKVELRQDSVVSCNELCKYFLTEFLKRNALADNVPRGPDDVMLFLNEGDLVADTRQHKLQLPVEVTPGGLNVLAPAV